MTEEVKWIVLVPCDVYSRITGFLRPLEWWNKGKREEFKQRKTYDLGKAVKIAPGYGTTQINKEA